MDGEDATTAGRNEGAGRSEEGNEEDNGEDNEEGAAITHSGPRRPRDEIPRERGDTTTPGRF